MSCKSDGGFAKLAGICTGWMRRRGITGVSLLWGGGETKVRMGGVFYNTMFLVGCSGGLTIVGGLAFLFLFLGGSEANMSGSIGPRSVSGGSFSNGEEGVFNSCLDSVSKQISASKYGWRGLARFSVEYSRVTEGDGNSGVFKFSSAVTNSGSTVGESG